MTQDVVAEGEVVQYALHSKRPSLSARGGWRAFWLTGPRSEMNTSISAGTGILTSISARLTPDESMIDLQPAGQIRFSSASAGQSLSYVATSDVRLTQALFASWSHSDDNLDERSEDPLAEATIAKSAAAGFSLGFDRSFPQDQLSFQIGGSVQRLERIAPIADPIGSQRDDQLAPTARVAWRHDIDRRLSVSLDGGLVYLFPFGVDPYNPDEDRESNLFPVVGGAVMLDEKWGRGSMSLRRDVAPNLYLAQNTVSDNAVISAAVPLPWLDETRMRQPKLAALGLVAITRTRLIDSETTEAQSTLGAARLDLGVAYTPRPGFTYAVRYELVIQTGGATIDMAEIQGFVRNTIVFTFDVRYPDQLPSGAPKKRARSSRGDGRDRETFGPELVVPDQLGEPEGGDDR